MKKGLCALLTLLVMLSLVACGSAKPTEAEPSSKQSFDSSVFEGIEENDASIFEYDDSFGEIVIKGFASETYPAKVRIPAVIDGKNVTKIMAGAFKNCEKLEVIILPEGVLALNGSTFMSCPSLIAVQLPETLESLSATEFSGSGKLLSLRLPASLKTITSTSLYGSSLENLYAEPGSYAEQWCKENGHSEKLRLR